MTAQDKTERKIGRPRKYEGEGKRPTLTFRVRGSLYERLQREAKISDKSLSEVIEASLDRYFETRDQYNELARLIGLAVTAVEAKEGKRYFDTPEMRLATRSAIEAILEVLLGPKFDDAASKSVIEAVLEQAKRFASNPLLAAWRPDFETVRAESKKREAVLNARIAAIDALMQDTALPLPEEHASTDPLHAEARFLRMGPDEENEETTP